MIFKGRWVNGFDELNQLLSGANQVIVKTIENIEREVHYFHINVGNFS